MRLLYANRDRDADDLRAPSSTRLVERHPDRLEVVHHLDVDRGFVDADGGALVRWRAARPTPSIYVCGPTPFMDIVETTLLDRGRRRRPHPHRAVHARRTPVEPADAADDDADRR